MLSFLYTPKFRIKFMPEIGYFAQVKPERFGEWKKICGYGRSFDLYSEKNIDNPLNEKEARQRCKLYIDHQRKLGNTPQYKNYP